MKSNTGLEHRGWVASTLTYILICVTLNDDYSKISQCMYCRFISSAKYAFTSFFLDYHTAAVYRIHVPRAISTLP